MALPSSPHAYADARFMAQPGAQSNTPVIENRKARHRFVILETLEVGIKLVGTEVRSVRAGKCSLGEGYVRAETDPWLSLTLHGVHIDHYAPAGASGSGRQHAAARSRTLLAHKREIRKLATATREKGMTIVPLKLYFKHGFAKLLIGVGRGKRQYDKRQDIRKREQQRDIRRAMSKRA